MVGFRHSFVVLLMYRKENQAMLCRRQKRETVEPCCAENWKAPLWKEPKSAAAQEREKTVAMQCHQELRTFKGAL